MDSKALKYPIYIISKGRWENPLTAKVFLNENIDFKIAVEPQEYEKYALTIPEKFIEKLPFSNLGLGSYPARNHCWEHSISQGFEKHFIFDDNIRGFSKFVKGKRIRCEAMEALKCLEVFSDNFENLSIAGYNYSYYANEIKKPFKLNVHVYSGMLIKNNIPYRWRMKYNEDVDLCLQVLNDKNCTVLLDAYSIDKVSTTAKMKGGNQDELYKNNDEQKKMLKSKSLEMVWPQYVKVVERYGRPHHHVSWGKFFKHPLIRKKYIKIESNANPS